MEAGGAGSAGLTDYPQEPADVSFVLDALLASERVGPRVDPARIGVAGLSLGGGTPCALIANSCCRDERIRAAAIFDSMMFPFATPFGAVDVPLLMIHIDPDIVLPYERAREEYEAVTSRKWFVTLEGGIHAEPYEDTPSVHDATVTAATIAYWQLVLLDDETAAVRLERAASVDGEAQIEQG